MKNKKKIFLTVIILIILVGILGVWKLNLKTTTLEQLKNSGHSQMMGYIIKDSNGKVIVIDGGTSEDEPNLEKHISELGNKVDVWFITHPHSDHAGAFIKIIKDTNISVGKVYYTMNDIEWYKQYAVERAIEAEEFENALQNERIKDKVEEVSINEVINIDFIKCEILGVKNPEITNDAFNNSSMVIKMLLPKTSILFLGDTGVESGEKLISTQKEKLKSDIVQVAHHGQNGANEDLYKEIKPKICLWPTPEWIWNNDNGEGENTGPWKTFETRKWIEDLGVKQNIIEKDGDITITIK